MFDIYNKKGEKITDEEWMALKKGNYYRVLKTTNWIKIDISTVWLGMNHRHGSGTPLIFETMVFFGDDWSDLEMDRYSTEAEALAGHKKMVSKWSNPFYAIPKIINQWWNRR